MFSRAEDDEDVLPPNRSRIENPVLCITGSLLSIPILDSQSLEIHFQFPSKKTSGLTVFWSEGAPFIAVGQDEDPFNVLIYAVSTETDSETMTFSGCRGSVRSVTSLLAASTDSDDYLIVAAEYNRPAQILVFSSNTGNQVGSLPEPPAYTTRVISVPEWNLPEVFVGGTGMVHRYDVSQCVKLETYVGHHTGVDLTSIAAIPSRNLLISGSDDKTVKFWSRDEYRCVNSLNLAVGRHDFPRSLYYVEDKNMLLVGCVSGDVQVWDDRQTKERVKKFNPSRFNPLYLFDMERIDTDLFVSVSKGVVAIWNPDGGEGDSCGDVVEKYLDKLLYEVALLTA